MARREPRWVVAFLRALERTGVARLAAIDAAVDHSTAYARRRAHPAFAERWADALRAHEARVKAEEEAEIARLNSGTSQRSPGPISPLDRRDLAASGGKVRRVSGERWGKRKEAIFFDVLAATASIRLSADAAGVSTNAILSRRLKHRVFAAKVDAVAQSAKVGIDLYLIELAKRTFDPDGFDFGDVQPKLSVDQAIRISQMLGGRTRGAASNPFHEEAESAKEDADVTKQLTQRLLKFSERHQRERLAEGWFYDESYRTMIPPGYVKGPDYGPEPPGEPAS